MKIVKDCRVMLGGVTAEYDIELDRKRTQKFFAKGKLTGRPDVLGLFPSIAFNIALGYSSENLETDAKEAVLKFLIPTVKTGTEIFVGIRSSKIPDEEKPNDKIRWRESPEITRCIGLQFFWVVADVYKGYGYDRDYVRIIESSEKADFHMERAKVSLTPAVNIGRSDYRVTRLPYDKKTVDFLRNVEQKLNDISGQLYEALSGEDQIFRMIENSKLLPFND